MFGVVMCVVLWLYLLFVVLVMVFCCVCDYDVVVVLWNCVCMLLEVVSFEVMWLVFYDYVVWYMFGVLVLFVGDGGFVVLIECVMSVLGGDVYYVFEMVFVVGVDVVFVDDVVFVIFEW